MVNTFVYTYSLQFTTVISTYIFLQYVYGLNVLK